jgi:hypothetical protein
MSCTGKQRQQQKQNKDNNNDNDEKITINAPEFSSASARQFSVTK